MLWFLSLYLEGHCLRLTNGPTWQETNHSIHVQNFYFVIYCSQTISIFNLRRDSFKYLITYLRLILHLRLLVTIFFMTGFLQNLLAGWLWKGRLGRLRTSAWVFPTLMTRTFQRRKSNLRKYTKRQWETSRICFFHERWLLRPWSRRRNIQLENNHHHQFFSDMRLFHVIYWWWNHILGLRTSH